MKGNDEKPVSVVTGEEMVAVPVEPIELPVRLNVTVDPLEKFIALQTKVAMFGAVSAFTAASRAASRVPWRTS
jgi:hypothetical protein